jgi:hypothetical protein
MSHYADGSLVLNLGGALSFPASDTCIWASLFALIGVLDIEKPLCFTHRKKLTPVLSIHSSVCSHYLVSLFLFSAQFPRRPAPLTTSPCSPGCFHIRPTIVGYYSSGRVSRAGCKNTVQVSGVRRQVLPGRGWVLGVRGWFWSINTHLGHYPDAGCATNFSTWPAGEAVTLKFCVMHANRFGDFHQHPNLLK